MLRFHNAVLSDGNVEPADEVLTNAYIEHAPLSGKLAGLTGRQVEMDGCQHRYHLIGRGY